MEVLHMKDSNQPGNARKSLEEKGYYIVLFLCVLAVGISGYLFLSSAIRQPEVKPGDETLSVPTTVVPPTPRQTLPSVPTSAPADGDEAVREVAERIVVAPVKGEAVMGYDDKSLQYNETTRDWRLHAAVDIAAPGQTVLACMAGTVTDVYDDDYLGTTVSIRHDDGYETRYSNLTAMPTVKKGDMVKAGDVIGAVGETAILESSEPAHLHFQVLKDGTPVDPAEFLG